MNHREPATSFPSRCAAHYGDERCQYDTGHSGAHAALLEWDDEEAPSTEAGRGDE